MVILKKEIEYLYQFSDMTINYNLNTTFKYIIYNLV